MSARKQETLRLIADKLTQWVSHQPPDTAAKFEIESDAHTLRVWGNDLLLGGIDTNGTPEAMYLASRRDVEHQPEDIQKLVIQLNAVFTEHQSGMNNSPLMRFAHGLQSRPPKTTSVPPYEWAGDPFVQLNDEPLSYYLPNGVSGVLNAVSNASAAGYREVILLTGPTGTGKTALPEYFARVTGRPLFFQDMGVIRDGADLVGHKELENDGSGMRLRFIYSDLVKALETPNSVVVFDEANRVPAHVLNGLFPLLDHRGCMHIPGAPAPVRVAEGVTFFLTMNLGSAYAGVHATDAAFISRVTRTLEVGYLPEQSEIALLTTRFPTLKPDDARQLVRIAQKTRAAAAQAGNHLRTGLSTRDTLKAAQAIAVGGLDLGTAVEATFVYNYGAEGGSASPRAALLQILQNESVTGSLLGSSNKP